MNHFNDLSKYRLEVKGTSMLVDAWSIQFGQQYLPEITPKEDFVYVIEVELSGKSELDEIENTLFSMLLETKHIEKFDN
jgi:hypothetical protein